MNRKVIRAPSRFRWKRSNVCYWCGRRLNHKLNDPQQKTREHLYPRGLGGNGAHKNIVAACRECNTRRWRSMDWVPFWKKGRQPND